MKLKKLKSEKKPSPKKTKTETTVTVTPVKNKKPKKPSAVALAKNTALDMLVRSALASGIPLKMSPLYSRRVLASRS